MEYQEEAKELYKIIEELENGFLTKLEAREKAVRFLQELKHNVSLTNFNLEAEYITIVQVNIANIQWLTGTEEQIAKQVSLAIGNDLEGLSEIDEEELGEDEDYRWIVGLFEDWGYIDIWFSKMPNSDYRRVVEYSVSAE